MKTAISIPDQIFKAAERLARKLGMSRSELYSKAVAEYLAARRGAAVTEALDRLYKDESSQLDPMLERLQVAELPPEEW